MVSGSPPCIRYNVLNLPDTIQFTAGHQNYYTYDASGKKLEVQNITSRNILNLPQDTITRLVSSTKLTTDYCGDAIYQNDTLKEVLTPAGYWQNGLYYYYLKDHQRSTREVLRQDNTVMEYSDYYPDGMRFWTSTSNSGALPYRYNGKEMEAMNGLNEYDYGARRRETGIPVWTTLDPLAEKYYGASPYVYVDNNYINNIDIAGDSIWVIDSKGSRINYTPGMQYHGKDSFVSTTFDYLNSLYANDYGKSVVEELTSSDNDFRYTNTYAKDNKENDMKDALSFAADANGGGEIHAGYLMDVNGSSDSKLRSMAHETFHGYQSEFGEIGREAYLEVEALLFQSAVMQNFSYFGNGSGSNSDTRFNKAMTEMMLSTGGFNQKLFDIATLNFLNGSNLNSSGLYTRTGYKSILRKNPIISRFFPLMPK
jgi:RHS repeat-associated protein